VLNSTDNRLLTRIEVVSVLAEHFTALAQEFSIASLALFGSYARDEQTPQSDVDLLVSFSRPVGFGFMHLADRLEALLGKPVDLVGPMALSPTAAILHMTR